MYPHTRRVAAFSAARAASARSGGDLLLRSRLLGRGFSAASLHRQSASASGAGDGVGRLAGVSLALLRLNLGKFTFGMVFRAVDVS